MTTKHYILHYLSKKWFRYVLGLILVFAATYFTTSIPRLLGVAIDYLGESRESHEILIAARNIGIAAFMAFALRFLWRFLIFGFTRGAETYVRAQIFKHLESLSSDFYIKHNTGDIITRAISDVLAIRRMFGFGFVSVLDAVTIFIVSGINMFAAAGLGMSLVALLPAPFLVVFIAKIRKTLRKRQYEIREASSNLASKVQENLTGIRVIKTYAQEESETRNFMELSQIRWDKEMNMVRISASLSPIIQIVFAVVFSVFIIFGSRMVAAGTMTLGDFTAFTGYIALMAMPIAHIGRATEVWQTGLSSIERLDEIFKFKQAVTDDFAEEDNKVTSGQIEFKNLSFAYPRVLPRQSAKDEEPPDVLKNISFMINPGETIAITGPIGCGKTTLASIILRQWKIRQGMIAFDGNDINSIPIKTLRSAIGYVPQDNFLFSETIMTNIRFYDDNITDEDVYTAAKAVSIHDNIMAFPEKYDTIVGERGMTLSGGQKQRISIARALVRKPKILLLDDCLSAVDAETEHAIISGLRQYMDNTTGIIITHRVAAASLADRILVLNESGCIAELGTYSELMDAQGEFFKLVQLQGGDNTEV
ncbi:MAG: ABC transporter ATP-binding protein/permease [Defluviitaleaceae bacterium]|nr:ABC transporter ATP-binding protein/permease [Defluviitaleaceae bacterium]